MARKETQIEAFIGKEFRHIFRDRRTIMILLLMPVIQIILFGFAISTEINNVRLAVLDPSKDVSTTQITNRLAANSYFTLTGEIRDPLQIDEVFRDGTADMVVVFPPNFHNDLVHKGSADIQLIADGTDPNMASIITNYATNIIGSWQAENLLPPQAQATKRAPTPAQPGAPQGNYTIAPQVTLLYNPQMKSAYMFVPGVMGLVLTLICAMMTAVSIVREKERGTMEIMLVSPMRPIYMILAKMVPYLVISGISLIIIVVVSVFLLGVPVAGNLWVLGIVSFLFILVSLALGLLISTLVRTQVTAMMISGLALMMPVVVLSGMIFPIESMPKVLQWVSTIIPARWYIASVRKVMIEGLGLRFVLREAEILTAMAALLIGVSLAKFKNRLS